MVGRIIWLFLSWMSHKNDTSQEGLSNSHISNNSQSGWGYQHFPLSGFQHIHATPLDISAKDVWTHSVCADPPLQLTTIRRKQRKWNLHPVVVFFLSFPVALLLPQQQSLFSRYPARKFWKMLPVKGNKAGTRSFAGNHRNTWRCPESDNEEGKCAMGWQPNNKKLQIETEEKRYFKWNAAICSPCRKHPILEQAEQRWNRQMTVWAPKAFVHLVMAKGL